MTARVFSNLRIYGMDHDVSMVAQVVKKRAEIVKFETS